ncbi:hypothetical protein EMPS_08217 [Entomortierella parvispora]|uniref:Glycosyltransferase family 34 protein n=1 Tax=Entomortierella parvispora TaxID=205924 RepID=A0A9P3HFL6_9FUNG|nr:hypothetical protein EMPS_08217 [Entomortierella parvispora]
MPVRKTHLLLALVIFMVLIFSIQEAPFTSLRNKGYRGNESEDQGRNKEPYLGYKKEQEPYKPPYGGIRDKSSEEKPDIKAPGYDHDQVNQDDPQTPSTSAWRPNTSGQFDTLVVIPSDWTQIQNRKWVRETVFGIKDNLEPCQKNERGRILYKFFVHGQAVWKKTTQHSAEYMEGQVREFYGEMTEFDDIFFPNTTMNRASVWGEALDWAVNQFIPGEMIKVDKVVIFDSTAVVNMAKMEQAAKLAMPADDSGLIYTWGWSSASTSIHPKLLTTSQTRTTITNAAVIPFKTLQQILQNKVTIMKRRPTLDLISASARFYDAIGSIKVVMDQSEFWNSDIIHLESSALVVAPVHQSDDWFPISEKIGVKAAKELTYTPNPDRTHRVTVMTSSYIYAGMCMGAASLPVAKNKREYAARHGYDFVARAAEFAQEEFRGRREVWGKIGAIQKVLPHYEWVFWMDMDAVVVDMDKELKSLVQKAEMQRAALGGPLAKEEISLIVAKPTKDIMLNAGVMLIKNTDWSRKFFAEVQKRRYYYRLHPWYEQAAIWETMREPAWASGVHLFNGDEHTMNTFPDFYENGDFIVHFAPDGCPAPPVLEALQKLENGQSVLGVGYSDKKIAALHAAAN